MITIEHLEILFDAERQRDEAVFARLFVAAHGPPRSGRAERAREDAAQAAADRSLRQRRSW